MTTSRTRAGLAALPLIGAMVLTGCVDNTQNSSSAAQGDPINVVITDDGCKVSTTSFPSGVVTFSIKNDGTKPNEFELLTENKLQIISEQENIGPGTTTTLTTQMKEGTYFSACKPNMVGALVDPTKLTVTKGEAVAVSDDDAKAEQAAVDNYTAYVRDQVGQLVAATDAFATAYKAGDWAKAKELFPLARQHYERIEPTAEAFGINEAGDLDAALDVRVQDLSAEAGKDATDPEVLADWTGWHRIEADLWGAPGYVFATDAERQAAADDLVDNTQKLYDLVYSPDFKLELGDVVAGAHDLMNEVATSKIVGEEDTFSHTDLYDFAANVEGAEVAYGNVRDLVEKKDAALAKDIDEKLASVKQMIAAHSNGTTSDGLPTYVDYSTIAAVQQDAGEAPSDSAYTEVQKDFASATNVLSEAMSKIAETILH